MAGSKRGPAATSNRTTSSSSPIRRPRAERAEREQLIDDQLVAALSAPAVAQSMAQEAAPFVAAQDFGQDDGLVEGHSVRGRRSKRSTTLASPPLIGVERDGRANSGNCKDVLIMMPARRSAQ